MDLSFSSFFSCSLSITFFTILLYLIMKNDLILTKIGIISVYFFMMIIIVRGILPFDFHAIPLTTTYPSQILIPSLQKIVLISLFKNNVININLLSILIFFWVFIALCLLFIKGMGYYKFYQRVKRLPRLNNNNIENIFNKVFKVIFPYKRNTFVLKRIDSISTPAVFGLIHPIIFIPKITYTEEELYYIFLHELLHVKHKDFLVKVICDIISSMNWWNPILSKVLPSLLKQTQEMYVDYSISNPLKKEEKYLYLNCLRKTIVNSFSKKTNDSIYTLFDSASKKNLLQRIYLITHPEVKGKSKSAISISLLIFVLSLTFVFEAFNVPKYTEDKQKVFYMDIEDSYYIENGKSFDLYLNGEYVYTTPTIIEDFKDLPIYQTLPQKEN